MTWIILLAAAGIAMISVEIIIPGGILGTLGLICTFAACGVSFNVYGPMGGLICTIIIFTSTALIIWLEFKLFPKTSLGKRAILTKSIKAVSASYGDEAKELIGKSGTAKTTLAPSGYIIIEDKRYEAFCQAGMIEAGTELKVVGADNFRLIVTTKESSSNS